MAAPSDYSSLSTAIAAWDERTVDADELIGLAEAEFRLYLGPNFAKEASAVLTFAAGSCAQPTGLVRVLALSHATYGILDETSMASVRAQRIFDNSGIPAEYAITGSTIETGPAYDGDLTIDFEGSLTGLSADNPTNWLILNAPQAYLSMCLSFSKAKNEDYANAAGLRQASLGVLNDLGIQSVVGQMSRATVRIQGPTP